MDAPTPTPTPTPTDTLARRQFCKGLIASAGLAEIGRSSSLALAAPAAYVGPKVIIIRFGGGVRRRETIDPEHSYAPFLTSELLGRGTLFSDMQISTMEGLNTSHGEGTLNILTGKYDRYESVDRAFLSERFESKVPTLFEDLRKAYAVPEHQTLIINGEDRTQEEFYSFSNHHLFGATFRFRTSSASTGTRPMYCAATSARGNTQARNWPRSRGNSRRWSDSTSVAEAHRSGRAPRSMLTGSVGGRSMGIRV